MELIKTGINKQSVPQAVAAIVNQVTEGVLDPLKAATALKWYESVITAARKEIIEQALKERAKYGKDKVMMFGYEVTQMEAGTSYDYSNCGDIEWERWDAQVLSATNFRKDREAVLKKLTVPMTVVNEATGEVYQIHPPVKKSTTTLKFS